MKDFEFQHLVIPRKPTWNKEMNAEDIDRQERIAFLQWRRDLAVKF
jgi:large subunit GTPase 1